MSGQVLRRRNGVDARKRPSWVHCEGSDNQLEMLESIRNVLEDVVTELQKLNSLLHCHNFTGIPGTLRDIATNTRKRTYTRKVK